MAVPVVVTKFLLSTAGHISLYCLPHCLCQILKYRVWNVLEQSHPVPKGGSEGWDRPWTLLWACLLDGAGKALCGQARLSQKPCVGGGYESWSSCLLKWHCRHKYKLDLLWQWSPSCLPVPAFVCWWEEFSGPTWCCPRACPVLCCFSIPAAWSCMQETKQGANSIYFQCW